MMFKEERMQKSLPFRKIFLSRENSSNGRESEDGKPHSRRSSISEAPQTGNVSDSSTEVEPIEVSPVCPSQNDEATPEVPQKEPEIVKKERPSDIDMMKERFAKLLLGEDMSGGGKGVSSALALSNAITNLAASVFGEQSKLEPMSADRKARWKREVDWLLSVTDYIVELVPSIQKSKDGTDMEIMLTQQRKDLLLNVPALRKLDAMLIGVLDKFVEQHEFWYISKDAEESERGVQRNGKWWLPTVKVPPNGLSEATRQFMQKQKEAVNQVLKASMAINAQILSDMEIPDNYIESLPKNGRSSLGESIYKNITVEFFDPHQFLSTMDMSTEHKVLDLKNRIEASIVIWKRKMNHKDGKSGWGSAISMEKRELFEERAETILLLLKHQFPGIPQSSLDISKIASNLDVGLAILESYSRVLESLANTVTSRIEDVLYADSLTQDPSLAECTWKQRPFSATQSPTSNNPATLEDESAPDDESERLSNAAETPTSMTLSDFMKWNEAEDPDIKKTSSIGNLESFSKDEEDKIMVAKPVQAKKSSYMNKIDMFGLRSPL